ncbi:calcium-binding protein [Tateyamaria sp. ANG-S1]|uniref:calcium-binding protein n=1 Tax=Tateyamaria sp. ANG-S1 TaxID=1577905 RepID=UPI00057CF714|nr:calcium-binding protein [Tateyamaria sp. ANG-S1]KIC50341.1 hypothetical protein RA29_06400 [Tateyamaria sp. ANG-S1]
MGALALLALMSGALMLTAAHDNDAHDVSDSQTPETDPTAPPEPGTGDPVPPEPEDTGATFDFDDAAGTITLDVGADETGTLASIFYVDSEDNPDNFYETYEARFYLVPEGTDLSDADYERRGDIPGQQAFGGSPLAYELEDFEQVLGLQLLGTVQLELPDDGVPLPDPGNMRDVLPDIQSNAPVAVHYLEANTDGDELVTFLNEDYVVTRQGVTEQVVTESTTGTNGTDWLTTGTEGLALDGGDGDDILFADHADTTLTGGAGDDLLQGVFVERSQGSFSINGTEPAIVIDGGDGNDTITSSNATIDAGTGDDSVRLFGGEVRGGEGDDRLSAQGDGVATLLGEAGNDRLTIGGAGSEAYGDDGDDFVSVDTGALGSGGAGNDRLNISAGATGLGGAGDDEITVFDFFNNEDGPATVTGGEGADTIEALIRNPFGDTEVLFFQITDFDPSEDVLQISSFNGAEVEDIEIVEDPGGAFTDVRVTFPPLNGVETGITVVRLEGTPGITEDQIVLTA